MCNTLIEAPPDDSGDWVWNGLDWTKARSTSSTATPTIRQLCGPDLPEFLKVLAVLSDPQIDADHASKILRERFSKGVKTFVYVNDGHIVGTASLILEPKFLHGGSRVGHIEDVAVLPEHQHKGIGTALVEHCVQIARETGCYKVVLACAMKNLLFYVKQGFIQHEIAMRRDL